MTPPTTPRGPVLAWNRKRFVVRHGEPVALHGARCVVCGDVEAVRPTRRDHVHARSRGLVYALLLLGVVTRLSLVFGTLLAVAVAIGSCRRQAVTLPECRRCRTRAARVGAAGWALALAAGVTLPALGTLLAPTPLVGALAGGVAWLVLLRAWRAVVTPRVRVVCRAIEDGGVVLVAPRPDVVGALVHAIAT